VKGRRPRLNRKEHKENPSIAFLFQELRYGVSGDDVFDLQFIRDYLSAEDEDDRQLASMLLVEFEEELGKALLNLNVEFFERLAVIVRAMKAAQEGDFYENPIAVYLVQHYLELKITGPYRHDRNPSLPEVIARCETEERWPKGDQAATRKEADRIARAYKLKMFDGRKTRKGRQ
jgi:hypothetical protein